MEEALADSWPARLLLSKAQGGGVCRRVFLAWMPQVFPAAKTKPGVLEGQD